jgi:hypothetical protein
MNSDLYKMFRSPTQVDEGHIELATKRSSKGCALAKAIEDKAPNLFKRVRVDEQTTRITVDEWRYVFFTPLKCIKFLKLLDMEIIPDPFIFQLGDPCQKVKSKTGQKRVITKDNSEPNKKAIVNKNGSITIEGGRISSRLKIASHLRVFGKAGVNYSKEELEGMKKNIEEAIKKL